MLSRYFRSVMHRRLSLMLAFGLGIAIAGCGAPATFEEIIADGHEFRPKRTEIPEAKTLEEILALDSIQTAILRYEQAGGHKALAISEDGLSGIEAHTNSFTWAKWSAIRSCNKKVQSLVGLNDDNEILYRRCFLYRVNDATLTPPEPRLYTFSDVPSIPTEYDLTLGDNASLAFEAHLSRPNNKAFAISPGGEWAESHDYDFSDDAAVRAVRLCNSTMDFVGDAQCHLYAINGTLVTPSNTPPQQ